MNSQRFALDTLSNTLGTLLAVAVVYIVGVLAGAFTFDRLAFAVAIIGSVLSVVFGGLVVYQEQVVARRTERQGRRPGRGP